MSRGMQVDVADCVAAFAASKMDPEELWKRYAETARYDLNPEKMMQNFTILADALLEKGLVTHGFVKKVEESK